MKRMCNRKLQFSTAPTKTKWREPAYSQALNQNKMYRQGVKIQKVRNAYGYDGWCLDLRQGSRRWSPSCWKQSTIGAMQPRGSRYSCCISSVTCTANIFNWDDGSYWIQKYGQQLIGQWCLSETPLIMDGKRKMVSYFPFWSCCPLPGMYSNLMWNALAKTGFQVQTFCVDLKRREQVFEHTPTFLQKCAISCAIGGLWQTYNVVPYSESLHATYVKIGPSHQKL